MVCGKELAGCMRAWVAQACQRGCCAGPGTCCTCRHHCSASVASWNTTENESPSDEHNSGRVSNEARDVNGESSAGLTCCDFMAQMLEDQRTQRRIVELQSQVHDFRIPFPQLRAAGDIGHDEGDVFGDPLQTHGFRPALVAICSARTRQFTPLVCMVALKGL
jgi:hypothetical protein